MKTVTGTYGRHGYEVWLNDRVVYSAGNHPNDSQAYTDNGLSLRTLRRYCRSTCKEIAKEHNAEFVGLEKEEID